MLKCDCDHVTRTHHAARNRDARAVDPHVAGPRQGRRSAAGTNQPGMPQPAIDALSIEVGAHLVSLLGVGLKLRLQGRKLRERRIRIGRLFALATLKNSRP
jgi:hypothetical protein